MDNIVESLFGLTPFQVQQQQNAGLNQAADRYASQDPFQRATGGMFRAGGMLGGAGAQAMGMVNPQMEQAKLTEAMMASGGDLSTSQGLMAKSQQFAAAGDLRTALKLALAGKAKQVEEEKAKLAIRQENRKDYAAKPDLEKYAMVMAKRSGLEEGSPEFDDFVSTWMYDQKEKTNKTDNPTSYREWQLAKAGNPKLAPYDEWLAKKTKDGAGGDSKQPLAYIDTDGKVKFGTMAEARGKTPAAYDPEIRQYLAVAGAAGKNIGDASSTAKIDLPAAEALATKVSNDVDELLKHPGFSSSVGATLKPGFRFIDGTKEASFFKRLEQIKGGAFLDAYTMLKGGGSITEVEGTKATAAKNRMDKSSSEPEFRAAAKDFIDAVNAGVSKLKAKAAMSPSPRSSAPTGIPSNAKLIGHSPDNREVYQTPDGKKWVE